MTPQHSVAPLHYRSRCSPAPISQRQGVWLPGGPYPLALRRPRERGAVLVLSAILFVVLFGFSALAVDLGRLYVLRAEMQNAADSAARAAAMELDGSTGARFRAAEVAANLLSHDAHFARTADLLGGIDTRPGAVRFFSWIGSAHDPVVTNPPSYCTNQLGGTWISAAGRCEAGNDATARYVQIRLGGDQDAYTVDLFFLPVLSVFGLEVDRFSRTAAQALAGRNFMMCNYPPLMFCNPFESLGETFRRAVAPERPGGPLLNIGDSVILKYQSTAWSPGNFAFLAPSGGSGSSVSVGQHLANPATQGCTPPQVRTATGAMQSHPIWGWNTRFDHYRGPFNASQYPPAPNVIEYPVDQTFRNVAGFSDRFGAGDWMRDAYWEAFHSYHNASRPSGYGAMTRWEVYNWEISAGFPPCDPNGPDGIPGNGDDIACLDPVTQLPLKIVPGQFRSYTDPWSTPEPRRSSRYVDPSSDPMIRSLGSDPIVEGLPTYGHLRFTGAPASLPERRLLNVAVLDCVAQDVSGNRSGTADSMALFFALQAAPQGSSVDDFVAEFVRLATEEDNEYVIEVILYE